MNDQPVATVKSQDRKFEKPTLMVKAEHKLLGGDVFVWFALPHTAGGGMANVFLANAVLDGRTVDLHAT